MILADFFPCPGTDGRSSYVLDIIDYLAMNDFEITLCILSDTPNGTVPWYLLPADLARKVDVEVVGNHRWGRRFFIRFALRNWLLAAPCLIYRHLPKFIHKHLEKIIQQQRGGVNHFVVKSGSREFVNNLLKTDSPDVLIFNYARLADFKEQLNIPEKVLTGVITHDVVHRRHQSLAEFGISSAAAEIMTPVEEKKELSKFDFIVAIQAEDAEIFKEMLPDSSVITAPMSTGSSLNATHAARRRMVSGRCLMVGGYGQPNIDSFNWFLNEVWPLVYSADSTASLHVCGNVCRALHAPDNMNISLPGRVKDLSGEYEETELCIIPLLAGSGLKIKLIEALKHNCRCVSTSCGVQGIPYPEKYGITVADNADAMAKAILLVNRSCTENTGKSFFEDFSPEKCYGQLVDSIKNHKK